MPVWWAGWAWRRDPARVGPKEARELVQAGKLDAEEASAPSSIEAAARNGPVHASLRRSDDTTAATEISCGGEILFDGSPAHVLMVRDVSLQLKLEQNLRRAVNLLGPTRIATTLTDLGVTPHLVSVSTCYVAGNRRGRRPAT